MEGGFAKHNDHSRDNTSIPVTSRHITKIILNLSLQQSFSLSLCAIHSLAKANESQND
jgi:hypothetical protein